MNSRKSPGTALVTGASSGIGATYADRLARRGYNLILVARNGARLEALAKKLSAETGVVVRSLVADLSAGAQRARVEQVLREDSSITVLVNNAGIGAPATFVGADVEELDAAVQLNVVAVMRLAAAVLPGFVARGQGTLINVGSVLALAPEMFSGVYSGTKAFVLNLSQSLRKELNGTGVTVQAVLPGATATEIWNRPGGVGLENLPPEIVMSVDELVDAALAGLDMGEAVTIPALPDVGQWQTFEAARAAMGPHLSLRESAARYRESITA